MWEEFKFDDQNPILMCQITELEGGHTDRVTSVVVVPVAAPSSKFISYCWTSSIDGTICYWDFSVPELIKKVKVQLPIHSMVSIVIPPLCDFCYSASLLHLTN